MKTAFLKHRRSWSCWSTAPGRVRCGTTPHTTTLLPRLAGVIFEPPNVMNHQDARVGSYVGRYTEAGLAGLCLHGGSYTHSPAPTKQQPRQALRLAGLFTSSRITRDRTPSLYYVDTAAVQISFRTTRKNPVQTKTKYPTEVGFGGPKRFVTRRCRSKSGTNSRG